MGCFSSKHAARAASSSVFVHPADNNNGSAIILEPHLLKKNRSGKFDLDSIHDGKSTKEERSPDRGRDLKKSRKESSHSHSLSHSHLHSKSKGSFSFKIGFSQRYVQAEQTAAGWPTWLSSVAGDAINGWVPLRADSFEKLEKIGQGTYSSVFRAREVETGRMVALKKVRVDNFQPESIRFMAREIMILRRLDHPNIVKLEGLITSRLSSSIYLVFEYMEHDLSGLISSPDVKFSEAQVKCYMTQLLCGIEHCHLRGIMHRDIKASNILVNNEGILKLGDFGLANIISPKNRQPLTSRVVTLWYRPPELLMGSTNYGVSVDLWSVGCVFAELLIGKPILKGRTEVEQLHKIFKLCGSPPDDFWKKSELPHAAMFKPLHNYESSIGEKCKDFPTTAVKLIETLLSIEPQKRGTASSALMSEYFNTQPFACAEILFLDQGITTAVVLGIMYSVANTFQPLPEDVFRYDWRDPFSLQKGWLLWAGFGLVGALTAIALTGAAMSFFSGESPQRETDALVRLLPLIGSSSISTACLVGITGVFAPVLEETVFRGFFMMSMTKWVPTPVAVIISAAVFALAHLTPGQFPQLFVLGTALGFSYAQTRNLLTPITIHAFWNSGVILLLTFLQLQGYDIKELLQAT